MRAKRHAQIECARRVVQAIAEDDSLPGDMRARAHYLSGNLAFLDGAYEDAVSAYDRALVLTPGEPDSGDPVGRDAAFNRAIALRRIEDKKDAGADASPPGDASSDASREGDGGTQDASRDSGGGDGAAPQGGEDAGKDAESPPPPPPDAGPEPPREAGAAPPPSLDEDQRMLDQLENAPTLQQEEAKRMGKKRVRGMADK